MFAKSAEFYDLIYSFKNYEKEASDIRDLVLREKPDAESLLDVACGTGEHARFLGGRFAVDGIDLQPEFVSLAQQKNPRGWFEVADMRTFDLGRRYDVVQCLFSSIGYLTKPDEVVSALQCFAKHLNPGGVIIVEPWFTPERYNAGVPHMAPPVDRPDLKIVRLNVSEKEGTVSIINFHYLVASTAGIEHFEERHELALYTVEEMLSFFAKSGLEVRHDPEGISGRGVYIARVPKAP